MQAIPLGKIAVATAGTNVPITLTAAQAALLPPYGLVKKAEVWPDPADTGVSKVYISGVYVAGLPSPGTTAGGHAQAYEACHVNPLLISIDNSVGGGQGPLVTLWVE